AGAATDSDLAAIDVERLRQLLDHARGHDLGRLARAIFDQHGELVAAKPRDRVSLADTGQQTVARGDKRGVARHVAEAVVDDLETVEVQKQDGDGRVRARGTGQRVAEPVGKQRPV